VSDINKKRERLEVKLLALEDVFEDYAQEMAQIRRKIERTKAALKALKSLKEQP